MNFGRQPLPVTVTLEGEDVDVDYWIMQLKSRAEFKGDATVFSPPNKFIIYPRAVNE